MISAFSGIVLIIAGIIQCRKRITKENGFISTEAEIIHIDNRLAVASIKWSPIVTKEYRPIIRYITEGGNWIQSALPYTMKLSHEYRDYKRSYESGIPLNVQYDPENPQNCHYGSKCGFRIREVIYKVIIGALLILIGYALVWSHFNF